MGVPFGILKAHLKSAAAGTLTQRDLTELVHISRAITQAHLARMRTSWMWLCRGQGLSLEDLAYDCLGNAFARDDAGRFLSLESFCRALEGSPGNPTDIEVFLAYRSFLARVADQALARLYAQADPIAGRIYRNTKDAVRKGELFTLGHDLRGFVLQPVGCNALDHAGPFPAEELQHELTRWVDHQPTIPEMLRALHAILAGQTLYRRSLPLSEVTSLETSPGCSRQSADYWVHVAPEGNERKKPVVR